MDSNFWMALRTINYGDVASRALWTFVQVFLATFIVAGESIVDLVFKGDWSGLLTLAIALALAGIAAGLSAAKTIIIEFVRNLRASIGR